MSNRLFTVRVTGLDNVLKALDSAELASDLDQITETYARKMANESAIGAPRKTGKLKNSFPPSVQKEDECVWVFGSDLPYALRQEYEHRTKKGFVRKSVWNNREAYKNKIRERLSRMGR
ncbi:hypothetical protein J1P26_20145 [Neobacillus sp. MM2021_6]|uniref:hypothetical protein n=1 Tax=Bacillaceae TaxID=186817 RepID=UPI00140DC7CF|nr:MULTISPECIES: hypothetical protein [Bacillaceae]MBO0962020.1 hypothetical protein [Neobacillus sp. MM2021_6]NHC20285.1 hypothetical protein [Bacillus sp. MM2020_4]